MVDHEVMDDAEGGHAVSLVFEPALYLARTPAFMPGMGHAQQGSDVVRRTPGRVMRFAGSVLPSGCTFLSSAAKPLIAGSR